MMHFTPEILFCQLGLVDFSLDVMMNGLGMVVRSTVVAQICP